MTTRVQGLDDLVRKIEAFPGKITPIVRRAIYQVSVRVRDDAKALAPVLKKPHPYRQAGTLRDAIRVFSPRAKGGLVSGGVGVKSLTGKQILNFKRKRSKKGENTNAATNPRDPFYALIVEKGSSGKRGKKPAVLFLTRAVKGKEQKLSAILQEVTRAGIKNVK